MVGRSVGHYRIVEKIGEGGVGQVYLAEDVQLDRKVALKVLAQPSPDLEQVARFEREAKAAAALDHPNILAIHEFGHDGGMPYVVMELLDGRNLRRRLEQGPLTVRTAIEYALEILRGLAAAHDKGIWHRDLKPENIFITDDGRVKILDFGLANVRGPDAALASSADGATREALTKPGLIVGTAGYMAPEQVRGEPVDGRADIFAFGAVLFEMLAARRAFDEPTIVETLHSILRADPPLHLLDDAQVPALAQVVTRCLSKRRDERFQSARDVASALQSAQSESAVTPPPSETAAGQRLDSWKEIASYLGRGVRTVQRWEREQQLPVHRLAHAKGDSVYADSAELDRWWRSRQRTRDDSRPESRPEIRSAPPSAPASEPRPLPRVERVTNWSAVTLFPALSSDGRMVVCVSDRGQEDAAPQVWLQQVGGAAIRLTTGQRECADPTFSADDTRVLFTAKGDSTLNVYEIPTLGGEARVVKRSARSARESPDGRWLTYIALESARGLRIEACDGGGRDRILAPDLMDVSCIVWSPDSKYVLVRAHPDAAFEPDFWIVPIDGRPPMNTGIIERLRSRGTVLDVPPAWVATSVVFSAGTREGTGLWRQRLPAEPFRITEDPEPVTRGTEWAIYSSAVRSRMAFVSGHPDMNLWSLDVDTSTGAASGSLRRVTRGPGVLGHLGLSSDGRTLGYFCTRSGMPTLYLRDLQSGSETAIPTGPPTALKAFPAISPDGRQLAHGTVVPGPRAMRPIFIIDLPTGASRLICEDCGRPRQWLDEQSILAETFGSRLNTFVIVDVTTGSCRPLLAGTDRSVTNPRVTPDGRLIAFDATPPGGSPSVFVAPLGRSAPISESEWILVDEAASHPFWSRDGQLLYFLPTTPNRDLRSTVQARRIATDSSRPEGDALVAATLKETFIPTLMAGTTPIVAGDQIVFVLADFRGDVWMVDL
jgi:serine/threonine protein kinase/Tol biopolymer transport system component